MFSMTQRLCLKYSQYSALVLCFVVLGCEAQAYGKQELVLVPRSVRVAPVELFRAGTVRLSGIARPITRGEVTRQYELRLAAPAAVMERVRKGDVAEVELPTVSRSTVKGRVAALTAAGPVVRFAFEARVVDSMLLNVRLKTPGLGLSRLPLGALISPTGEELYAFAVREGRAVKIPAVLAGPGLFPGGQVSVAADFQAGDQVVTAGYDNLLHGDPVEVLP